MESIRECGVVYKFMHFTGSFEVVNEDYKRQGTESGPLGHTAAKCFPEGNELTRPMTIGREGHVRRNLFHTVTRKATKAH